MNKDDGNYEILNSWFAVIGMIIMYWSPAERFIDQIVHTLYKTNNSSSKRKKPTRLGSKIEYIEHNMPDGLICSTYLNKLGIRTKATAITRDIFVHGLIDSYSKDEIVITKVDGKDLEHVTEKFTYNFNKLNDAAMNIEIVRKEWAAIALKLVLKH